MADRAGKNDTGKSAVKPAGRSLRKPRPAVSRAELEGAFNSITQLVMLLGSDYTIKWANKATATFFKLPMSRIIGSYCYTLMHGTDNPAKNCPLAKMMQSKKYEQAELYIEQKKIWAHVTADPQYGNKGNLRTVVYTVNDITKSRQVEHETQRLASVVQYSSELVNLATLDGKMIFLNEAGSRMLGIDPQKVDRFNVMQVIPDHLKEKVQSELLPALMKGDTWMGDLEYLNLKTGQLTDVHAMTFTVKDPATGAPLYLANVSLDITERKNTEVALLKSEERFRRLSENAPDIIYRYRLKPTRCFEYISPVSVQISGYTPEEFYADPLLYRQIVHPEDRDQYADHFRSPEALRTTLTLRWIHKDGRVIWAEEIDVPVYDANGELIAYEGTVRNITTRKQIEEALRESEGLYRLLSDHTTDFVWLMDMNLKPTYQSPSAQKLTGFTQQELIELPFEKRVTPESLKLAAGHFLEELPGIEADPAYNPVLTLELEIYRKDGTTLWSENKFSVIRDEHGRPVSILGEARDVTERKRVESALKESEEKYRLLVENARDSIMISVDGMLKFANRRTTELTGYDQEELTSRPFIEFIHTDDRQIVIDRHVQRLKGMDPPKTYTFRIICKSGDIKWVELTAMLVTWEGRLAILNFLGDVTDRKRLEEEQQRVEKLESVGVLAGGIAHDFNNILTAILGNISLARIEAKPGSEIHNSLEQAEKASLRAKDLTQQLLTFSRGGAPITKLTSLAGMLKDTAGFALRGSKVKCRFSIPDNLWHAEIDTGQISQVIHNLVINALQAMPTGGTIDLRAENMALGESQNLGKGLPIKAGHYIRIAVTDRGVGISPNHLGKIFDPFFTTKQKGSGLGLATSFSIARNHGGHLSVESKLDSGSTFYLYLPASMETIAPKQDKPEAAKPASKARILVMDDEQGVLEVAGRMLKQLGYGDVEFAADGAEAVKLYQAALKSGKPFSLSILDLTIPGGMGGKDTIKKLLEIDPGTRAIVSSGYTDDSVMAEYRRYGFSAMAAKPYTLEQLGKALQDVFG